LARNLLHLFATKEQSTYSSQSAANSSDFRMESAHGSKSQKTLILTAPCFRSAP